MPRNEANFDFAAGQYAVELFGKIVSDRRQKRLFALTLELSAENAKEIADYSAACSTNGARRSSGMKL
jgi:hypothetical protein